MEAPESCHLSIAEMCQLLKVGVVQVQHGQSCRCCAIPPCLADKRACQQIPGVVQGIKDRDQQLFWELCPVGGSSLQHAVAVRNLEQSFRQPGSQGSR